MAKYCLVNNEKKVSRFFNTKEQCMKRAKRGDKIITKKEAIANGLFVEPKHKVVRRHMDISLVKGLYLDERYKTAYANKVSRDSYLDACAKNGWLSSI